MKNKDGVDVKKRRQVNKKKVLKIRDEDYAKLRERIREARAAQRTNQENAKIERYGNMYSKFADNYTGTLASLVEQSRNHMHNKAKNRRKIRQNEEPDHVRGRDMHHKLIAQMKEVPAY